MIVDFLNGLNELNNNLFLGIDEFIENFGMPEYLTDALVDTIHLIPFLFLIFLIIEIIEFFKADKITSILKKSEKTAVAIGSLAAIFPQCGFSVMAGMLYLNRIITKGTLIAIFLATSDEAIPILLANPNKINFLLPLIFTKLIISIFFGYLIDFWLKDDNYIFKKDIIEEPDGCCGHKISKKRKRELIFHPIIHTVNISAFIFIISLIINILIASISNSQDIYDIIYKYKFFTPFATALFGLIPNCAISIALTMLLIKGSITFGGAMAGLLANSGLGIIILFKDKNNTKDTLKILAIIYMISVFCGIILQFIKY